MNLTKKKGFTLIELVIVIAVIGILAAVLIPTFTSVIGDARESSAMQSAKSAYTAYLADTVADGDASAANESLYVVTMGKDTYYCFTVIEGVMHYEDEMKTVDESTYNTTAVATTDLENLNAITGVAVYNKATPAP